MRLSQTSQMACLWVWMTKETTLVEQVLYRSPLRLQTLWSRWWCLVLHVMRAHVGEITHPLDNFEYLSHGVYQRWSVKWNPDVEFFLKYTCQSLLKEWRWGLMISVDWKLLTFNKMSKMFNRQVDGQEFYIEYATSGLCGLELLGEVGDWASLISNIYIAAVLLLRPYLRHCIWWTSEHLA